ncbi:hypothetical protein [Escherichia coli]|uniref:hypothetical protein n=2 Tax=Escherichia coli TaxID=562 RepID=UPI001FCEF747|nr:hypothetical protein [Escherichia coli]
MSRINKQLNESNSTIYTPAFVESISKVDIPAGIYLKSADYFDDKYINSTSDSWVFDYSGSRCYAHFRRDKISNQLTKYICFRYASAKCPAQIPGVLHAWSLATDHCITQSAFTFTVLKDYLETQEIDPRYFYYIIFGLKILCAEAFPGFTLDDYEDLEFIPRPHSHDWDIYQEIDHVLDPLEKSMISKGLFEMATSIRYGENYSLNTIRDAAILGLTYVTGARPAQLAKLATKDLRIDTRNPETGLIRYSLLLPYAKQRRVTTERLFLAIPAEIGALIRHYIERAQLKPDGKLFEFSHSAPFYVSKAISKAILRFSPPDYQAAVARGEAALPTITPTDLRHNVGHSLAMMRTHIPRHNINTFLAIADIADHLQAMLMGRVDITQNQHYQHLALAERRKAASLVPLQPISTALTAAPSSSSVATPLEIVKRTGQLAVTEHMTLDNTIKANLHTFDDRDDVARFVEASFADGLFEDVAAAFEEIRDAEGPEQASAMVARHAVMYPLKFGSCMREVNLWGCPYRLKCQSAAFCEHFTLTGRIDELPNLIAKKQALQQAHSKLTQLTQHQPDYQTRLADIERRLQQLEAIQAQWQRRAKTQQLVAAESVLSGGVITEGKVRTLAQLFALEYQQLMQEND